jgi:hypothetical protein
VKSFDPLARVPLGVYQPAGAAPANTAARAALHGSDLLPNQNLGGYVSQPADLITTLSALPALENTASGRPRRRRRAAAVGRPGPARRAGAGGPGHPVAVGVASWPAPSRPGSPPGPTRRARAGRRAAAAGSVSLAQQRAPN